MPEDHQSFREHTRTSVQAEAVLQFGSEKETLALVANLSEGGMFIASRDPKPVGTLLRFQINLQHAVTPATGYGEVTWIRVRSQSARRPAGMGIKFRHLEGDGKRALVNELAHGAPEEPGNPAQRQPQPDPDSAPEATAPLPGAPPSDRGAQGDAAAPGAEGAVPSPPSPSPSSPSPPEASRRLPPELLAVDPLFDDEERANPDEAEPRPRAGQPPWPGSQRYYAEAAVERRRSGPGILLAVVGLALVVFVVVLARAPIAEWIAGDPAPEASPSAGPGAGDAGVASAPDAAEVEPVASDAEEVPATAAPGSGNSGEESAGLPDAEAAEGPASGEPAAGAADLPDPGGEPRVPTGKATAPAPVPPADEDAGRATAAGPPFSVVTAITWTRSGGRTVVTITGDGPIPRERIVEARVGGERPRAILRLAGVERPFQRPEIGVGSPQLVRIRTGYHPELRPRELHVVFDLAGPEVQVLGIESDGAEARVYLGSG